MFNQTFSMTTHTPALYTMEEEGVIKGKYWHSFFFLCFAWSHFPIVTRMRRKSYYSFWCSLTLLWVQMSPPPHSEALTLLIYIDGYLPPFNIVRHHLFSCFLDDDGVYQFTKFIFSVLLYMIFPIDTCVKRKSYYSFWCFLALLWVQTSPPKHCAAETLLIYMDVYLPPSNIVVLCHFSCFSWVR